MLHRVPTLAAMLLMLTVLATGCYNPTYEKAQSRKAMDAGDYPTAADRLAAVTDYDPSDWEAHYLLGMTYLGMDQPIAAQTELEQALAANDRSRVNTPKILDGIAQSLYDQQRYEELYQFLDEQIERYEGWEDYARKARFLAEAGDADGAALAYREAAYFSRNRDEGIYIEIADFYEGLGDHDKSLQALKWAYWINEKHPALPRRFRQLGYAPGPTLREEPPQPEYPGARIFDLPRLFSE